MHPYSIGLTGGIGSGKSTVATLLETFGYPVFYSDIESKKIINNPAVLRELCGIFGESILLNGKLNKVELAQIVFNDEGKLQQLNAILHPKVRASFDVWRTKQHTEMVFNEAAILFETDAYKSFDKMLLVVADKDIRTNRVMARDGASLEEIEARMRKQWLDEMKIPLADFVIENSGKEALTPIVRQVLDQIQTAILTK